MPYVVCCIDPTARKHIMSKKTTTTSSAGQSNAQWREAFGCAMAAEGFVPATQKLYARALDRFAAALKDRSPAEATVRDARDYLARLKRTGRSKCMRSSASAALRFFFTGVRHLDWEPVSPLRQRMIEDMELRSFSARTQQSYVRSVLALVRYYDRTPDQISDEEIRKYFVHLTCERKLARPTITIALCGIKFFYQSTLGRDWSLTGVPVPKRQKKLPVVLSRQEVFKLLGGVQVLRHRACLSLIYACGLRLGEGCRIRVADIDRARGLLHVHSGKGAKDRYVPLPGSILPLLEDCWRAHRNPNWLFPAVGRGAVHGAHTERHVPIGTIQGVFREAYKASGLKKAASVHSLRHAYATHLLEAKVDLRQIQQWLGHTSPSTTAVYAHVTEQNTQASSKVLEDLMAPLK
jgi:site-specific recombinase XerD